MNYTLCVSFPQPSGESKLELAYILNLVLDSFEFRKKCHIFLPSDVSVTFPPCLQESELESLRADAFVVMFSIADQESYRSALDMVRHLRVDLGLDRAILLVGNKCGPRPAAEGGRQR